MAAAKISALSSSKIDECEYLTCEKNVSSTTSCNRRIQLSQTALEKQIKTIDQYGTNQVKALQFLGFPGKELLSIIFFLG